MSKTKMTRKDYIKTLTEEYRNLNNQEIEIKKRKAAIQKQLDDLKDKEAIDTQLVGIKIPKRTLDEINNSLKTWGNDPKDYQQNSCDGNQYKQK